VNVSACHGAALVADKRCNGGIGIA
jgi:hypothetical protein